MASTTSISIIVPVHIGQPYFVWCLESIRKLPMDGVEIIVVADGDGDLSWKIAPDYGAQVHRIDGPSGPARARNQGASVAQSDLLFFLDADVAVSPQALGRIRQAFANNPDLAAVIGSYDDQPADQGFISQYRNLLHHYVHQTGDIEASTFWGACGAIRRSVFLEAGGFDERYRQPAIEDIAFGYRLRRMGHRIRLDPSLFVKHLKRWTAASMIRTDLFQRAIPWGRLLLSEGKLVNDLNLRTESRISVALALTAVLGLAAAPWLPVSLLTSASALVLLFALNLDVYRFFYRARGAWFALRVFPWHVLYYLYSGLGFATAILLHLLIDSRSAAHGSRSATIKSTSES